MDLSRRMWAAPNHFIWDHPKSWIICGYLMEGFPAAGVIRSSFPKGKLGGKSQCPPQFIPWTPQFFFLCQAHSLLVNRAFIVSPSRSILLLGSRTSKPTETLFQRWETNSLSRSLEKMVIMTWVFFQLQHSTTERHFCHNSFVVKLFTWSDAELCSIPCWRMKHSLNLYITILAGSLQAGEAE